MRCKICHSDTCICTMDNLKKKVEIYEKCLNDLKNLDELPDLENSIIIVKDNEGNMVKKIPSDLSESFLIIDDNGKETYEMTDQEINNVDSQNNLHDYNSAKKYFQKAGVLYSFAYCVFKFGKWVLLL